jgi:hypothetical protein
VSSERVGAALFGEASLDAPAVVVEDLAELVACVGQDAGRGDLVGLAGEVVALDRDVETIIEKRELCRARHNPRSRRIVSTPDT